MNFKGTDENENENLQIYTAEQNNEDNSRFEKIENSIKT